MCQRADVSYMLIASRSIIKHYRLPSEIIQYFVWLYHGFNLSHGGIDDLLAECDVRVNYQAIRLKCNKIGLDCAGNFRINRF